MVKRLLIEKKGPWRKIQCNGQEVNFQINIWKVTGTKDLYDKVL